MGAVLSGLEIIAMGGAIANQAQIAVLKNQIHSLWQQHQGQIEAVAKLYEQVDKMSFNQSLFAQLNTSSDFALQNWGMIAEEIKSQSKLIGDISKDFSDTLANRLSLTEQNFLGLGLSLFGFTLASFMFWKDVAPNQYEKVKANIKENIQKAGKTVIDKVKTAGRKLKLSSINEEGRITQTEIPSEAVEGGRVTPEAQNPKNKGRWSKGTIATTFIRVGFLCFMIYSFIEGRIHINDMIDQLNKDRQYFSDKGKFYQDVQHCVDAIKIFVCDVSNLAQASRAIIEELHCMYLTKVFVQGTSAVNSASRADELTTANFGLTDDFIDKCDTLRNAVEASDKSQGVVEKKLQAFVKHFTDFYAVAGKVKPPNEIFLDVTAQISSIIGKDSVMNNDLFQKQKNLFDVGDYVKDTFKSKRPSKLIYKRKSPEQKATIDKAILDECEQVYKEVIIEDTDTNLRPNQQAVLAGIIMNFCDQFHATDPNGQKLYGLDIATFKGKETYGELLDQKQHESTAQNIPVQYNDQNREQAEVNKLLKLAQAKAKDMGANFADVADLDNNHPQILGRYINLVRIPTGETDKDVPKIKLLGSNGLKFKIRGQVYAVQQEIVDRTKITLTKGGDV